MCTVPALLSVGAAAETVTVDAENETIQDAIDRASTGDTVEIPGGTYQTQLDVSKDITLTSVGSDDVVITTEDEREGVGVRITSATATIESITVQGTDIGILYVPDPTAEELSLTIQGVAVVNNRNGIEFAADNTDADGSVNSIEARDNGKAISVYEVMGELSVEGSELISNEYGIAGNPTSLSVSNTDINRNEEWGVSVSESKSVSITDTNVNENGAGDSDGDNIYIGELSTDSTVTIENVEASSANDNGIVIESSQTDVTISDITANQNGDVGVWIQSQSAAVNSLTANGNGDGILSIRADTSEITDVETENTGGGIYTEGSDIAISDVTVESNTGDHGIDIPSASTVSISESTVSQSSESNIVVQSEANNASVSVTDVTATESESYDGIHIDASSTSVIDLSGITANSNDDNGLDIHGGTVTISDTTVSTNVNTGLIFPSVSEAEVSGITATGNGWGVWFEEIGTKASITDSTITGSGEEEIGNDADRDVQVTDSTVGVIGTLDEDIITDGVVPGDNVATENPDLESRVVADFTINPSPPRAEEKVTFDASDTKVIGGSVTSYEWDLNGDGSSEASGKLAETTYQEDGVQEVTLTVVDDEGREDSKTEEFEVSPSGINTQISTTKTELTTDEQTAIEYSITNYLTNEESEVQMIVESPSGVIITSTHNVDESSNQVTLTETVAPTEQESFRFNVIPDSPGTYEVTAIANYQSTDGTDEGEVVEETTFEVTEATSQSSDQNGAADASEAQTDDPNDATDTSEVQSDEEENSDISFWDWIIVIIFFYGGYRVLKLIYSFISG
jgi:hypothetical protein